jgi:hypothetical protein
VRVADCVPVLLSTTDGRHVAAVHAGWRGVVAQAVIGSLREMVGTNTRGVVAAIGPAIGYDSFEVGEEVLKEFTKTFGADAPVRAVGGGKGRVDLRECLRRQLVAAGVPEERIDLTDRCTYRDSDEFFSHRRDKGITGRMAALISPIG